MFNENSMFLFKFGSYGDNPGQLKSLRYIAVDSSDRLYVTDSICDDGGISVFSEDGHFVKKISCNQPFAIGIAPDDYIITDDHDRDILTVFSPTHELVAKFGVRGKEKGQFENIQGIAINSSGTIFIAEGEFLRLLIIVFKFLHLSS